MSEVDKLGVARVMEETCDYLSARWAPPPVEGLIFTSLKTSKLEKKFSWNVTVSVWKKPVWLKLVFTSFHSTRFLSWNFIPFSNVKKKKKEKKGNIFYFFIRRKKHVECNEVKKDSFLPDDPFIWIFDLFCFFVVKMNITKTNTWKTESNINE